MKTVQQDSICLIKFQFVEIFGSLAYKGNDKNVLIQFSGQGCREYEMVLKERKTDWQNIYCSFGKNKECLKAAIAEFNAAELI